MTKASSRILAGLLGIAVSLGASIAGADVVAVNVPATSNIYGAGHAVPPAPGGNGGGVLPTMVSIPAGTGRKVSLSSVSGSIDFGPCCVPNDADGIASAGNGPSNSWDGIGGMTISRGRFLGAVFLDDGVPSDPPPAPLAIPDIGFATLSPGLRQTFFVGDGLTGTGSGAKQIIHVPAGATRLFLGVHDAGPPDSTVPGWYGDNSGTISADVELTADPTSVPALPLLGLLALFGLLAAQLRERSSRIAATPPLDA